MPIEQTHEQTAASRALIRRLGVPTRETTHSDGARVYEFRIGTRRFVRRVTPTGEVIDELSGELVRG